jgi:hypothetical protein
VQELHLLRDQAREHLRRLNDQIGEALAALADDYPTPPPDSPARNFVVDRSPVHSVHS